MAIIKINGTNAEIDEIRAAIVSVTGNPDKLTNKQRAEQYIKEHLKGIMLRYKNSQGTTEAAPTIKARLDEVDPFMGKITIT